MKRKDFTNPEIEIINLENCDIIVTSIGIPLPDEEW